MFIWDYIDFGGNLFLFLFLLYLYFPSALLLRQT